jgi:hypothetical protein
MRERVSKQGIKLLARGGGGASSSVRAWPIRWPSEHASGGTQSGKISKSKKKSTVAK